MVESEVNNLVPILLRLRAVPLRDDDVGLGGHGDRTRSLVRARQGVGKRRRIPGFGPQIRIDLKSRHRHWGIGINIQMRLGDRIPANRPVLIRCMQFVALERKGDDILFCGVFGRGRNQQHGRLARIVHISDDGDLARGKGRKGAAGGGLFSGIVPDRGLQRPLLHFGLQVGLCAAADGEVLVRPDGGHEGEAVGGADAVIGDPLVVGAPCACDHGCGKRQTAQTPDIVRIYPHFCSSICSSK